MASTLLRLCLAFSILLSLVAGDASFYDVRTRLVRDHSGRRWPPEKYFTESTFHPHYDGRFADKEVEETERLTVLTNMMKTFLSTMNDIGAETWIMHGTLLGWWWNQKILPWDSDVDVQVTFDTISMLAKYFNMTEYHYQLPGGKQGTYLLEINPHYINGDVKDRWNRIDGRWIDTNHGLFIDISTIRPDMAKRANGVEGALMVKDMHHYLERDIFPLRDSFFEGMHVKVPFEYMSLLAEEYGERCFTETNFERHHFNDTSKIWEPMDESEEEIHAPTSHSSPPPYAGPRGPYNNDNAPPQLMSKSGAVPPPRGY